MVTSPAAPIGRRLAAALGAALLAACAPGATSTPATRPAVTPDADTATAVPEGLAGSGFANDSLGPNLVPAGHGTLRQDDVAIRVQYLGLVARFLPLDESVIRVLAPDAYRSLRDLQASRRDAVEAIARRYALAQPSLWYVSFYGVEQGETRFDPLQLTVSSGGRDYRPVDAIPLTPGFGEHRLAQRETQAALYVFDGGLDVNQPFELTFQTVRSTAWDAVLRRVERERSLVRSRLSRTAPP
jgi:hypothetical protein